MSYLDDIFTSSINNTNIKCIFELGSRNLVDAERLYDFYNAPVYSFECNPDCIRECVNTYERFDLKKKANIHLITNAISMVEGDIPFYAFDLQKYNNMGSSSLLKIDFSKRDPRDPDYNRPNPQKMVMVKGIRLDTFMRSEGINGVDLICMDLQGYELEALKSMGDLILNTRYIITETSITSTYEGGSSFDELNAYLENRGFKYMCSNKFGYGMPDMSLRGFSEFDVLFVNTRMS